MQEFLKERDFESGMERQLLPLLRAARCEVVLHGYDGGRLFAVRYDAPSPRGTVLLLHGLNESTEKYRELIAYFLRAGLSVLIYDQRGHGRSVRCVRRRLIHIDRFEQIENAVLESGRAMDSVTVDELNRIWDENKHKTAKIK